MPELPEVETICNDLKKKIIDKKITKIKVRLKKIARSDLSILIGKKLTQINRKGKYIFIKINNGDYLSIHLRMTGQLIYQKKDQTIAGGHSDNISTINLPNKQTHIIITFADDSRLYYNDQRQFGYLEIINQEKVNQQLEKLGAEPLQKEFNLNYFKNLLKNKKTNIKALLLNQAYIAGIGNIYADEILFAANVLPTRRTETLTKNEIEKIFLYTIKVIQKAIKMRGTTFNNYVDAEGRKGSFLDFLQVYNREGEKCSRCKNTILKTRVAGRGTRYCPVCQK
jgi:formamidopyrimidine-DNA glycosylase